MVPQTFTDFLVPTSSFLTGAGTVVNLAGNYFDYNVSDSPQEADYLALCSDWQMLGKDFEVVINSGRTSEFYPIKG